ncbi:MAG: hypothetical protein HUJ74_00285 [Lachnospiraceae bacterium]|nr:hypothetical protein [Lachnospiraceae bacterium]
MTQQILELKNDLKEIRNVNINAVEEFKELQERYTFLYNQYSKLSEKNGRNFSKEIIGN